MMTILWLICAVLLISGTLPGLVNGQGCPYGWVDFRSSDSCYFLSDPSLGYNYGKAFTKCQSHRADLVRIDAKDELKFLKRKVKTFGTDTNTKKALWWVGIRVKNDELEYIDGSPLEPIFKNQFDTNQTSTKMCGAMAWNGTFSLTEACSSLWTSYICERPKNISLTCDVDNQWMYSNGACYKTFAPERSWTDARRFCMSQDADLAKITDREVLAMIYDIARGSNSTKYWLGLRADGKQFQWTDNTVLEEKFSFWSNQKSLGSKRAPMCVFVNGSITRRLASLATQPCSEQLSFACSKKPGMCPDGWLQHQTSCFHIDQDISLTWRRAKSYCRYRGGDLAMLKTPSDQAFLRPYMFQLRDAKVPAFWIGLSDENFDSGWTWNDGDKLNSSLSDWAKVGAKNTPGRKDCVYVNTASAQWRSTNICSKERPFFCEVPAGKTVKPAPFIPAADQCESGWEAAGPSCVRFKDVNSTWYAALNQCQSEQAELLMVASDNIEAYLEGRLTPGETFWLGLSDREKEGSFFWVNGSQLNTANWAMGEPSGVSDMNCAVIKSDWKTTVWKMDSCQSSHKYICYKAVAKPRRRRMSQVTTTAAPYDAACGKDWELRSSTNFCYQFRDSQMSWIDALGVCTHHNGSLVSITSKDEQSYIEGRLKGLSSIAVWIGANDRVNEAGWSWEDGAPFSYLNWFPGEPNNMGNKEDCAAINTASMGWYDYACSMRAGFICKKPANSLTTTATTPTTTVTIPEGKFYGCPAGWLAFQDNCFLLRKLEVSWPEAQTACVKEASKLASIHSLQENQVIFSYLPKVSCRDLHSNSTQCQAWASMGECQKNPQWMSVNCKASCSYCKQTCSDTHTQNECRYWASIGECSKNDWMSEHCAHSCGCDSSINYGFWIGLNDRQTQMSFIWSDFTPVTFTDWAKNEPNNFDLKNEDCVKMFSVSGQWSDEVCDQRSSGYVCKKKMEILAHPTVAPEQVGCPIGAFGYGSMCFMLVDLPMSWQEAKGFCNRRKANLVTITDRTTGAFVTSELIGKTSSYWLGLRSVGTTYSWSSGSKVMYTPWAPSHTGNVNNSCVAIRSQRPVGLWEDSNCQKQQPFVCEVLRVGYTTSTTTTPSTTYTTTQASCPEGWKDFGNNCYKLHTDIKTWSEAQSFCQLYGGSLPSIHNLETQNFLATQLTYLFNPDLVWIGLSDADQESTYKWTDGSPFDYSKWGSNEPNNNYGTEDCVQLHRSGDYWNDRSCYTSAAFVCSVPRGFPIPSVLTTIATPPALSCGGSGWLARKNFCYFVSPSYGSDSQLTWFEANRKCMSYSGHLASISTQAENDFILSVISKTDNEHLGKFWIGFNELGQKSYEWSDGSPPIFLGWSKNEPNDAWGGQKCVNMYSNSGRWNDDNCMDRNGYVCKKLSGSSIPFIPFPTPIVKTPCPPGFQGTGLNNRCYFLGGLGNTASDLPIDWKSARDKCRRLGSSISVPVDITSISSRLDQDFITLLIRNVPNPVWIGFSDQQSKRVFQWQDNSEVTFTNWGQGEPNDHWSDVGEKDCVEIVTDPTVDPTRVGKWKIETCQKKNAYLCHAVKVPSSDEATSPSTTTTAKPGTSQCPSNYFLYSDTCFNIVPQLKTWQDARKSCQFFGGELASTLDVFDMARLDLDIYNHNIVQPVWIGLSYNTDSSSYEWSDNWPLQSSFWSKNDPDRQTNNSCVTLHNGYWNDTDCSLHRPFICAIRKGNPPTPRSSPVSTGHCSDQSQTLYGDFCYSVQGSQSVSWPEAVYACGRMGMDLVSVHSLQESVFLYNLLISQSQKFVQNKFWDMSSASSKVWIGLTRDGKDGFRWSDKSDVSFFHWSPGQPSSKASSNSSAKLDEACVEMDAETVEWNSVDCLSKRQKYICKVKKVQQSTVITTSPPKSRTRQTSSSFPKTEPYIDNGHSNLKEPSSGLTGGQIAGIILGIISFFVIVAVVVYLVHQRFQFSKLKSWAFGGDSGFENAVYTHHAAKNADGSVEANGCDEMSSDNGVTLGSSFA